MSFLSKIFSDPNEKYLKKLKLLVDEINGLEKKFEGFSDEQLKKHSLSLKENDLKQGFALVREASKRKLNQRHYDVQLMGGIALHEGKIAEMKTGEGKTLASTLPIYLNALSHKGAHVITVNDYLAKRDAVWMGQIYHALGLSVGCIVHDAAFVYTPQEEKDRERDLLGGFHVVEDYLKPVERKQAYEADITYGTNNEFGFDYLRDNMVFDLSQRVQRGFHFALIDEIDSVLIDESRTPLIISQPDYESSKLYKEFSKIIPRLQESDYELDEKMKAVFLNEKGIEHIEKILGIENIYEEKGFKFLHYLEQSLRAQVFFKKDIHYIVKQGQVIIIDEFTGRLMPGRRYSGGLHQAIEAKEGVPVQPESKTLATITFQNYFRMYQKLAGMTGTALSAAEEFDKVYGLDVVSIPTNELMARKDLPDLIYQTEKGKFKAVAKEVKKRNELGQPVLIGTRSVEKNEHLSKLLDMEGVKHEVLNAKNHQREGEIIAQAGKKGSVTLATNMAGRGVDIVLGGNPPEESEKVKDSGGLFVLGTERHEARRIDNQLRGRAGRQGDPGSSRFFVSLEDELLRIFGGERIKSVMSMMKLKEDEPIASKMISSAIEKAQTKVEGLNFDVRKHVLEYDDVISKQRNKIYAQRNDILEKNTESLKKYVLDIIKTEIEGVIKGGEIEEIKAIVPLPEEAFLKMKDLNEEQALDYVFKIVLSLMEQKQKEENFENLLRFVVLKSIDDFWTEHLVSLDHLKDSVRLRAYGGKDPLIEYKTEGHKMFQNLWDSINFQIARTIFKLSLTRGN